MDAQDATIVQRTSEVSALVHLLRDPPAGLSICSISGPGGVGKTFLLDLALESLDLDELGYLVLAVDAANAQARGDFFAVLEGLFRASLPPPADPRKDYFPRLRELAALHRTMVEAAAAEIDRSGAPESVKKAAVVLLRAAQILNRAQATSNPMLALVAAAVDDHDVQAVVDTAWTLVRGLKTLHESDMSFLPGPLRDLVGVTRRNRLKKDLYRLTAEELRTDLAAAVAGYEGKDRIKMTQPRIPGRRRVLLVIDDYEVLGPVLADFLVGALVPELAASPLEVVVIILGRDELEATHPGWAQHCKRFLRRQLRLAPFDEPTALGLLAAAGVPAERQRALFAMTQGYPFLLSLVIEEATTAGADSALFLKKFYDRTTRWMSPREQGWFVKLCYLERVDEDTLARLFPAEEVARIQDWFEREPSVRDPTAADFRVRALIRDKILRYEELRAPSRFRTLAKLAAAPPPGSGS